MHHVAIDLGSRKSQLCVRTPDGKIVQEGKVANDQLARALAAKLITYATGRAPDEIDHPEVERIVGQVREQDYGLKSLILAIVHSPLFREK